MDIYEYLKLDHDHVDRLFKQFEKSELKERKKQIVDLIAQELFTHAQSEQDTFYQVLESHEESKDEAVHGRKEHQEIFDQIQSILTSKDYGSGWTKKVDKLKDLVSHHVKEEEGKIFREAKQVISDFEACMLKEQMHNLKQELLLNLKAKEKKQSKAKLDATKVKSVSQPRKKSPPIKSPLQKGQIKPSSHAGLKH